MRSRKFSIDSILMFAAAVVTVFAVAGRATAQTTTVLHYFTDTGVDGYNPQAGLTMDATGNLYGTTYWGGLGGQSDGTVYEVMPNADGSWSEKVLHTFHLGDSAGFGPYGGVILDGAGNLYGTTFLGPGVLGFGGTSEGGAFELIPEANGSWTYKVLHVFNGASGDGISPLGNLVFDASGNLYGATYNGISNAGIVYELTPNTDGLWSEKILYPFCSQLKCKDGAGPTGGLIFDAAGNLYGLTGAGANGFGVVYELTPTDGGWKEKVLYNFRGGSDGAYPYGNLAFDKAGNLYGTTNEGGTGSCSDGCGTVFELRPIAGGGWSEKVLHNFVSTGNGDYPYAGLILDAERNLYGTTSGGSPADAGTVFELSPTAGGAWTEKILNNLMGTFFSGPHGGLIFDPLGNLYGATPGGGPDGRGYVFKITP